nr:hypothetical protein [Acidobacteriota bacterium]
APASVAEALDGFAVRLSAVEGVPGGGGGGRGGRGGGATQPVAAPEASPPNTLWAVRGSLAGLMNAMQAADVAPTANTRAAVRAALGKARITMERWRTLRKVDLPALNVRLQAAGVSGIR